MDEMEIAGIKQDTLSDRMKFVLDRFELKKVHLAKILGLTPASISDLLSGKAKGLSGPVVELLYIKFGIKKKWLSEGGAKKITDIFDLTCNWFQKSEIEDFDLFEIDLGKFYGKAFSCYRRAGFLWSEVIGITEAEGDKNVLMVVFKNGKVFTYIFEVGDKCLNEEYKRKYYHYVLECWKEYRKGQNE